MRHYLTCSMGAPGPLSFGRLLQLAGVQIAASTHPPSSQSRIIALCSYRHEPAKFRYQVHCLSAWFSFPGYNLQVSDNQYQFIHHIPTRRTSGSHTDHATVSMPNPMLLHLHPKSSADSSRVLAKEVDHQYTMYRNSFQ